MKILTVIGLLFAAAIFATIPISPQLTPRGLEMSVDQAQAITYGRYRRVYRRAYRRAYYGYPYSYGGFVRPISGDGTSAQGGDHEKASHVSCTVNFLNLIGGVVVEPDQLNQNPLAVSPLHYVPSAN